MSNARVAVIVMFLAAALAQAQDYAPPTYVIHPNQQVRVLLTPQGVSSGATSASLAAAVATVFQDPEICCGRYSSLESAAATWPTVPAKDLAARLQGRHILSDGRTFVVTAEIIPPTSMNASQIIVPLQQNHPILMQWGSRWYVLTGADYDETIYGDGTRDYYVHNLLLLDFHKPDAPKAAVFNRQKDDWSKVQGLLLVSVTKQ